MDNFKLFTHTCLVTHLFLILFLKISQSHADYLFLPGFTGNDKDIPLSIQNTKYENDVTRSRQVRNDAIIEEDQDVVFRQLAMMNYQPRKRHLEPGRLMKRMGDDFDSFWMSAEHPRHRPQPHISHTTQFNPSVSEKLSDLNFTYVNEDNTVETLTLHEREVLERWLTARATCPVYFTWLDMGSYFWPRWIRKGKCDVKQKCSWPAGMHCVPEQSETIRLLTWQCRSERRRRKRPRDTDVDLSEESELRERVRTVYAGLTKRSLNIRRNRHRNPDIRCKWVKTRYPVTRACYCSC